MMRPFSPSEHDIQASYIVWLNLQHPDVVPYCFALANGGNRPKRTYTTRSGTKKTYCPQGIRLKREGVKKGLPDIGIFLPRYDSSCKEWQHGMFIEFKTHKGKTTKDQDLVIERLRKSRYNVQVCHSLDEAMAVTNQYLRN